MREIARQAAVGPRIHGRASNSPGIIPPGVFGLHRTDGSNTSVGRKESHVPRGVSDRPRAVPECTELLLVHPSALYAGRWLEALSRERRNRPVLEILGGAVRDLVPTRILDLAAELDMPTYNIARRRFLREADQLLRKHIHERVVVGISCWTSLEYLSTVAIAEMVKKNAPRTPIIVGGYHVSTMLEDFVGRPDLFDHLVTGPGEDALRRLLTGRTTERVVAGEVRHGEPRELVAQPLPHQPIDVHSVFLSRGCPFECSFCVESLQNTRGWRALDPETAADLIIRIDRTGNAGVIEICDACFAVNTEWRRVFLELLLQKKVTTKIWAETRADLIEARDIELFDRLPFIINFGLDSGSPRMLKLMNKTREPERYLERARKTLVELNARRLPYSAFLIFNHPGETQQTFRETIAFLDSASTKETRACRTFRAHNYFHVPGSLVDRQAERFRIEHGTRFLAGKWWREKEDHLPLASRVVASRELEAEFGDNIHYWIPEFEGVGDVHNPKIYIGLERADRHPPKE